MLTGNELELKSELTLGVLNSNALEIKSFVIERLKDYTVENYAGRAEEAKADRAVLNNAEKTLNAKRLELERQYMRPFDNFKAIVSDTCKAIKEASSQLDEIVKAEEEKEKEKKFEKIQNYWNETGFTLFDIAQVFKSKWLNKTSKFKIICEEIDAIQKKALDELKIIEQFAVEDQPLIKAVYLDTLDLSAAIAKANQLKENRDRLAREQKNREELALRTTLHEQAEENQQEEKENNVAALVAEIIPEKTETGETVALEFTGTCQQLLALKKEMTRLEITYRKLKPAGSGIYTREEL